MLSSWAGESGGTSQKGRWSSFRNERYRKRPFTRYSDGAGPPPRPAVVSVAPKVRFSCSESTFFFHNNFLSYVGETIRDKASHGNWWRNSLPYNAEKRIDFTYSTRTSFVYPCPGKHQHKTRLSPLPSNSQPRLTQYPLLPGLVFSAVLKI